MQIIEAVKKIEWRLAWQATQRFLMAVGCIALGAWFANLSSPWWMAFSVVWLGMIWYLFFLACRAIAVRQDAQKITRVMRKFHRVKEQQQESQLRTRRRFAYWDADKGEEVYTNEFLS